MKRLIFPFIVLITLLASGCSEKFKIAAPYKNITVVYAFLDLSDTAHYIRIEKGFLDENKSALSMAKDPDSSFYANINVRIERLNFATLTVHDTIHLNRVDLGLEGYPKDSGQFFNTPNYAYKFTDKLDPLYIYRLKITNLTTGNVDSADAPIIDDSNPAKFEIDALDSSLHIPFDFSSTAHNKYLSLDGSISAPPGYNYMGYSNPATIGNMYIRFNWDDSDVTTKVHTHHHYDYNAGYTTIANGVFYFKVYNTDIYSALASVSGMGVAPQNQVRLMDRCDVSVYVSTPDYATYQQASLSQGLGLTGTEIEPIYTNIKGANVLGLYTSRGFRTGKVTISSATIDSMISGTVLSKAIIRGTVYH